MSNESAYTSAEDKALVKQAQKGDMLAFEELVARHRDKIYARAYSMIRNEEEAVDLSQEAWVKAWQRLAQLADAPLPVSRHWLPSPFRCREPIAYCAAVATAQSARSQALHLEWRHAGHATRAVCARWARCGLRVE